MFCERCGREIPEDSLFCNYCGVQIPPEQRELDWEEAARLRESRAEEAGGPAVRASGRREKYDAGCVAPGAPKKKCAVCGRELPASTLEDLCALCTMRRQQEEEARIRQRELEEYERAVAAGEKDRYDVSDEYDWRAFQEEPSSGWQAQERAESRQSPKKKKRVGCAVFLAVFALILIVPNIISLVWGNIVYKDYETYGVNELVTAEEDLPADESSGPVREGEFPDETWEEASWAAAEWRENSRDMENFEAWVRPMAQWALESCLPLLSDTYSNPIIFEGSESWYTDGARNRVTGWIEYTDEYGESDLIPFDMVLLISDEPDGAGYVLCFQADGQTLFDDLDAVDREGRVTPEGLNMFEEAYELGEYPFEDAVPMDFSK